MTISERHTQHATPGSSLEQRITTPFTNVRSVSDLLHVLNVTAITTLTGIYVSASNYISVYKYDATPEAIASNGYKIDGEVLLQA
jgi:hypothetical protein